MTGILQELDEIKQILECLADILGYVSDAPDACERLARLAARKVELAEHKYCFPDEAKE